MKRSKLEQQIDLLLRLETGPCLTTYLQGICRLGYKDIKILTMNLQLSNLIKRDSNRYFYLTNEGYAFVKQLKWIVDVLKIKTINDTMEVGRLRVN